MNDYSVFLDKPRFDWAFLAHLGYNMWADPVRGKRGIPGMPQQLTAVCAEDYLRFDPDLWHEMTKALADAGCNMIVLDIGEGSTKVIRRFRAGARFPRRFCRRKFSI